VNPQVMLELRGVRAVVDAMATIIGWPAWRQQSYLTEFVEFISRVFMFLKGLVRFADSVSCQDSVVTTPKTAKRTILIEDILEH